MAERLSPYFAAFEAEFFSFFEREATSDALETSEAELGPRSQNKIVENSISDPDIRETANDFTYQTIGNRFVLKKLIKVTASYDLYSAKRIRTDEEVFAKAYSLSQKTGKQREARVKNLKRNLKKPSCLACVDEQGRKWIFLGRPPQSKDTPSLQAMGSVPRPMAHQKHAMLVETAIGISGTRDEQIKLFRKGYSSMMGLQSELEMLRNFTKLAIDTLLHSDEEMVVACCSTYLEFWRAARDLERARSSLCEVFDLRLQA